MQPEPSTESATNDSEPQSNEISTARVGWMVVLTFYAIAFGGTAIRIVPGGPFFSMSADILPVVTAVAAILIALSTFRTKQTQIKLLAIIPIVICCFAITNVVTDVMWFWVRPAARGDLIGF